MILEADIREAIGREEFSPYFQPIVRLEDHQIVDAVGRHRRQCRRFELRARVQRVDATHRGSARFRYARPHGTPR